MKKINIAIDGPVSSGKSTISKLVAQRTNKRFISTGSIYRVIAYKIIENNIDFKNTDRIIELLKNIKIDFNDKSNITVDGIELTSKLRTEEISTKAAVVAAIPQVREALVSLQRQIGLSGNVIMEGRDIGTVILPNAELKIYLTCDSKIRAQRRFKENQERGIECSIEEIIKNIEERDYLDMNRKISPLKKAKDAIEINSSYLTINEVVNEIINKIKE